MRNQRTGNLTLSDRAIEAKDRGLFTYSELSAWAKRAVDAGAVRRCEWHHTSAAANCTDFYDPADFYDLHAADFPPVKVERAAQSDLSRIRLTIRFDRMVGGFSRRAKPKWESVEARGLDVRKRDNAIIGADGRRLTSNNESVTIEVLPPRCRKWREVSRKEAEAMGYTFG